MKIGIYDDGSIDRRGGGYSFKSEVIQGIAYSCKNVTDEIFIFRWCNNSKDIQHNSLPICEILIEEPILLRFLESMKSIMHRQIKQYVLRMKGEKRKAIINPAINALNIFAGWRSKIIERKLIKYGTNLIIYMEAFEILTYRIPFMLISWDIGHLYSPFFPETNFELWNTWEYYKTPAIKRAVHIIVGTEVGKKQIHSQYRIPENRISVLPFATPIYLISNKSNGLHNNSSNFRDDKCFLIFPSSYWPHKNHYILIEAMNILIKEKQMDIQLVLCGSDKGNKRFIENQIHHHQLSNHVFLFDFLDRNDLNYLYSKALALVYPTFVGPDNFPPLEAFGLGCPVIASAVEGAQEQLGDCALLFDPFSKNDLTEKIMLIRNDQNLRNVLIQKGYEKARCWNSNDYASSLLKVVENYRPYSLCYDLKTYRTMYA
jgi:glycosyltransferase involved in cell wall biosynthesis